MCFEILYWIGNREGELLALTAEDINLTKRAFVSTRPTSEAKEKMLLLLQRPRKANVPSLFQTFYFSK